MTKSARKPAHTQEPLFLVDADQHVVEPGQDPYSVDLAERAIWLGRALDDIAQATIRDAFAGNEQARRKYGGRADAAAQGAIENAAKFRQDARFAFERGAGYIALIDVAPMSKTDELRAEAAKSFRNFAEGVGDESGKKKSIKLIREELQRSILFGVTNQNRAKGERPHKPEDLFSEAEAEDERGLPTREKLILIAEDPRAGFIPTTNHEKNLVTTYLDYLDNPEFPLGPQNQLIEVVNFQLKHHGTGLGKEYGDQAGRSIAYAFSDFYEQATTQLKDLEEVAELLHEINNPNLSLIVGLEMNVLKAIPLIRFMDLAKHRATGETSYMYKGQEVSPKFDVLRSRRNEAAATGERNKVMQDPYTGTDPKTGKRPDAVTKWLMKRTEQIRVGEVRDLIAEAIVDQRRRQMFHEIILKDFAAQKTDMSQLAEARRVARATLGLAA